MRNLDNFAVVPRSGPEHHPGGRAARRAGNDSISEFTLVVTQVTSETEEAEG
jgi:hypothetical protein